MAARAKREEKNIPAENEIEPLEAEAPVAVQRHRIVTEFKKTVPIDNVEVEETEDEEPEDVEESDLPDPIEGLLREIGASPSTWTMVIDRLPNYHRDGAAHPRAKSSRCGTLTLTVELLKNESYIEEIQTRWARPNKQNDFRLCVRKDNRIYAYLPVLSLEPPDPEVIAKIESSPQFQITMPNQDNSLDAFLKQAEKMGRLREAMGWGVAPIAQNPEPQEKLTTETALLHLISQEESIVDQVIGKFAKSLRTEPADREISWMNILFKAIENNTLPAIMQAVTSAMRQSMQTTALEVAPSMPVQAVALAQSDNPPAASTPEPLRPELFLLSRVVEYCGMQANPTSVAAFVNGFVNQHPEADPFIEMFLNMPAAEAITFIESSFPQTAQIVRAPHAPQWIADLQAALTESDEPNDRSVAAL